MMRSFWGALVLTAALVFSEVPAAGQVAVVSLPNFARPDVWHKLPKAEGTPIQEIVWAARAHGVPPHLMLAFAKIESSFDPKNRTGSYKGLFQLSDYEFDLHGYGGSIWSARDNAWAAASKLVADRANFIREVGREPTHFELYMIHQQGWQGAAAHAAVPTRIAWRSMYSTDEGKLKGVRWSKKAIWGNVPSKLKRGLRGGVARLTSGKFLAIWKTRVDGTLRQYAGAYNEARLARLSFEAVGGR